MSFRRAVFACGFSLLVAASATFLVAAACDGCPCPMAEMKTISPARCPPGSALASEMSCCERPPASAVSAAPSSVAAPQLTSPLPARNLAAVDSFASLEASTQAPAAHEMAAAERRHDLGLCILNSVLLI